MLVNNFKLVINDYFIIFFFIQMTTKMALAKIWQTFSINFPEDNKIEVVQRLMLQPKNDLLCTLTLN